MNVLGCSHFMAARLTFLVASICVSGGLSFLLNFSRSSNIKCGENLTSRAGSTGEIKSPRFPSNYPDDVDCEWKIRDEKGSGIKLTFTDFEVECYYDFLEIYSGGTKDSGKQVSKLCGSSLPDPIELSGIEFLLRFHSDSSINFKGFKLQFASTGQCGGDLTSSNGKIRSPRFPLNYPDDIDCEWKIRVEEGLRIKLTFIHFEVEPDKLCKYDSLEVYNGGKKDRSKQVAKLCRSDLPDPIESSGNELLLRFHSDSSVNFAGFKLQFASIVKCGGNLTTRTGEIKSPRFPLEYPNDVECEWKIRVEEALRIKLTFIHFEVESSNECMFDSLEIYNGETNESSSRVAKLCGSDLPEPIESSGKELILRFQSDSSLNIKGFKLRFASTVKPCIENEALGMESGKISNQSITASSYYPQYPPWTARLRAGHAKGWYAMPYDSSPWIQVDLGKSTWLKGVATQGKMFSMYVTSYKLAYSLNQDRWFPYRGNQTDDKVFSGNTDPYGVVKNNLDRPVYTRFVRVYPVSWNDALVVKFELYGCAST